MSYIAFLDMIGTRASALVSSEEYTAAINDFNYFLKTFGTLYSCKIYGYSDNAYVEIEDLIDLVNFFRKLRIALMRRHRYFTAAVDCGSLMAERVPMGSRESYSMKFTAPATIDIYMKQCQFSGIGVLLSKSVVDDLKQEVTDLKSEVDNLEQSYFCHSVYQKYPVTETDASVIPFYDLSYEPVIYEQLEYIIADYLVTAATNERAGRYYITPVISMIKSLDKEVLLDKLDKVIGLLSFDTIPECFRCFRYNNIYSRYFIFALIEYVLCLREHDQSLNSNRICEKIIRGCNIEYRALVEMLPTISPAIISNKNKKIFLSILYNVSR